MNKDDFKEKIIIAKEIVKELKNENSEYDESARLFLRTTYNDNLGIYG